MANITSLRGPVENIDGKLIKLGISEGSTVVVDNANGKFNITPADDNHTT